MPRGRLKHQQRSLCAHPARRPAVDGARPRWLKREAKVSRKRWCRPEAYRASKSARASLSGRERRAPFFVQPHAALIHLIRGPLCVVVVGGGTSGDPPLNCVDPAWWTFFPHLSRSLLNSAWAGLQVSCVPVEGPARPTRAFSAGAAPRPCSSILFPPKL